MNVLHYVLYSSNKSKIVNGTISVVNFNLPLSNKLDFYEFLSKLSSSLSPDNYINDMIDKEDREGILNYLGDSKRRWAYFVPLLIFKLLRREYVTDFYRYFFDNPRFVIRQHPSLYGASTDMINFVTSRIHYKYLSRNTISLLLTHNSPVLHKKYYGMLREYFPSNVEYKEKLAMNNSDMNLKYDIRNIIYNLVYFCKKDEFNNLEEFINTRGLHPDYEYRKDMKNTYSRKEDTLYIETFHGLVQIKLGRMSKYVLDKPNIQLLLNELKNMSIHNTIQNILLNGDDLRAIVNYIGDNNVKWKYISKFITTVGFKPRYNNRYEQEALRILNDKRFYISEEDVLTNTDRMPDEIKLKVSYNMIPYLITSRTNVNVLYCLVYSLLNDIFKNNVKYWTKVYTYRTNIDKTRLIKDKHFTDTYLELISTEEDIHYDETSFVNLLAILSTDYYKLGTDMSNFNSLKDYYLSIKPMLDNIKHLGREYLSIKNTEKEIYNYRRIS